MLCTTAINTSNTIRTQTGAVVVYPDVILAGTGSHVAMQPVATVRGLM